MARDISEAVFFVVALLALLLIVTSLVGAPTLDDDTVTEGGTVSTHALLNGTQWTTIGDSTGTDETVYDSRGYAVQLAGADDSYVQATQDYGIATNNQWTVSTWARANQSATSEEMTAVSVDGRVIVNYIGSASEWRIWYYDEGERDSYNLSMAAPNQPGNLTNVQVHNNGTHLQIYRNNTLGDTRNITTDNIADAPTNASNWDGTLEELRTFDESLNNTQRQALVDNPVQHQPDWSPTARAMFDEPYADDQLLLYTDASLETYRATYVAGFGGTELSPGNDYEWNETGPAIRAVSGGAIDGAPVAYVDYSAPEELIPMAQQLRDGWATAMALAAVAALLLILGAIVGYLFLAGGRR